MADKALAELPLRQVKLGQLPRWLGTCSFTPMAIVRAFGRASTRYTNKYINVKKGTSAPITHIVLAVVLVSYTWRYQNEVHYRQRKYHW